MVITIEFIANTAGIRRRIKLMNPTGGGDGYHVYIEKFYNGTIVKLKGQWVGHLNAESDLSDAQIKRLGEIIEEYEAKTSN